ncbi:MAG: lysophospholipid acyltransferase family protein [Flavipsychrobacter sp.]|nr:lysophospholipid acyltransferase family protein [Flavipsychrobacter sp.]
MYYLLLIFLYPLALLPLRVLYVLSDVIYVLLYHIAGYRKQVVLSNLRNAFPEKDDKEIRRIMRLFYHSFCDQWMETLKLLTISPKELNKRITGNWEVFHELNREDKNTYILLGHTFNWEWGNVALQYNNPQQFAGVYQPVANKGFDKLMLRLRSRGGGWMISMKAKKGFQRLDGVRYLVGLIADQNPSNIKGSIWLPFMHRPAPFFKGPEQLATRAKAAVTFVGIKKIKRGYYNLTISLFTKDASQLESGVVTKAYVAFMEQQLREQPENWLWSHKRWKHQQS